MIRIQALSMPLTYTSEDLRAAAAKKLRLSPHAIRKVSIARKSVDARKKEQLHFTMHLDVAIDGNEKQVAARLRDRNIAVVQPSRYHLPNVPLLPQRPVVVGLGPGGLFAAWILASCGQRPIVLERGAPVAQRTRDVNAFWQGNPLSPDSNVQFGEGGAGTFSDGKLATGINDPRIKKVLSDFVAFGAPEDILYEAKPHVGTDRLAVVVQRMREAIVSMGGEVRFHTKLTGIQQRDKVLTGLTLTDVHSGTHTQLPCSTLILAPGHSARDTFEMLHGYNIPMAPKPFSMGARIEHPALLINQSQYGRFHDHPALGAADYKLQIHLKSGRSVYSFCMCPGGVVVGAASEPSGITTNGMSDYARNGSNSNAALLVGLTPADFGSSHALAGIALQRQWEQRAFQLTGGYRAPAQRVADFMDNRASTGFDQVQPTYRPGVVPENLRALFPSFVTEAFCEALPAFGRRLKGFDLPGAVLTGPETRSSSPVRILRDETGQSPGLRGLFPCGEGAGYAGGITSAAVDGIKSAEALLRAFSES